MKERRKAKGERVFTRVIPSGFERGIKVKNFKKSTTLFTFKKRVSTETSVIFSSIAIRK